MIADFNMPEMNGLQLLKHIRTGKDNLQRNKPVAMITGVSDKNLVCTALILDVNAFIMKPVHKSILEEKLERIFTEVEREEFRVRPVECYTYLDVNAATQDIGKSVEIITEKPDAKKQKTSISASLYTKRPKLKYPAKTDKEIIQDEKSQLRGKSCSLFEVPIGSVLAEDLYDKSGRKLLASGQTITKGLLDRIRDINVLGIDVNEVFIRST